MTRSPDWFNAHYTARDRVIQQQVLMDTLNIGTEHYHQDEPCTTLGCGMMPDIPHRYSKGNLSGFSQGQPVYVHTISCSSCGSVVSDTEIHDQWHSTMDLLMDIVSRSE